MITASQRLLKLIPILLLGLLPSLALSDSYIYARFGNPVVIGQNVCFSTASLSPRLGISDEACAQCRRLICIDRISGEQTAIVRDPNFRMHIGGEFAGSLAVVAGPEIRMWNPKTLEVKKIYTSNKKSQLSLSKISNQRVRVWSQTEEDEAKKKNELFVLDLETAKVIWRQALRGHEVAEKGNVLVVQEEELAADGNTIHCKDFIAFELSTGKEMWRRSNPDTKHIECFFKQDSAFEKGLLLIYQKKLSLIDLQTGELKQQVPLELGEYGHSMVFSWRDSPLLWSEHGNGFTKKFFISSVSLPDLSVKKMFDVDWYAASAVVFNEVVIGSTIGRALAYNLSTGKKLWQGGQWRFGNVSSDQLYYSSAAMHSPWASIMAVDLGSGKRKRLFSECIEKSCTLAELEQDCSCAPESDYCSCE